MSLFSAPTSVTWKEKKKKKKAGGSLQIEERGKRGPAPLVLSLSSL